MEVDKGGGSNKCRSTSRKRGKTSAASAGANGSSEGDSSEELDTDDSDREVRATPAASQLAISLNLAAVF